MLRALKNDPKVAGWLLPRMHSYNCQASDGTNQCFGILDRPFVPHVDSPGHPETTTCTDLSVEYRRGKPHWALRDGEVLVVDSGRSQLLRRTGPST